MSNEPALRFAVQIPEGVKAGHFFKVVFNEPYRFQLQIECPAEESSCEKLLFHVRIPAESHFLQQAGAIQMRITSEEMATDFQSQVSIGPILEAEAVEDQYSYIGRRCRKTIDDLHNSGQMKVVYGNVEHLEKISSGESGWRYMVRYDNGDVEHLERAALTRLQFTDPECTSHKIDNHGHSDVSPLETLPKEILITAPSEEVSVIETESTFDGLSECSSPSVEIIDLTRCQSNGNEIACTGRGSRRKRKELASYAESASASWRLPKIKFGWQLSGNQTQCENCGRWWQTKAKCKEGAFTCAMQRVECGTMCLTCQALLPVIGGGKEGVLRRAEALLRHMEEGCKQGQGMQVMVLRKLILDLEDMLPWRAVLHGDQRWNTFRERCKSAPTCAILASTLSWLVQQVKPEALEQSLVAALAELCDEMQQIDAGRGGNKRRRADEDYARLVGILMLVDEEMIDWRQVADLNRRWETNVYSEALEQECGFRYTERNELGGNCLSERARKDLADKMAQAHESFTPSVTCSECWGCGRNREEPEEDCVTCYGTGVVSGDSPLKLLLCLGTPCRLRVKEVNESKGLGVFAEETIEMGSAVCEYVGELVTRQETSRREGRYVDEGLFYLFEPRRVMAAMQHWVIDATRVGNVARFVNHACGRGANLVARQFFACGRHPSHVPLRVALVSTRRILPGEELLYDYAASRRAGDGGRDKAPSGGAGQGQGVVRCSCGHRDCCGWVL